jgi:hypothetical protein
MTADDFKRPHYPRVLRIDIGRGKATLRAHFEFAERQVPLERK